jgi:hypothetical protein
MVMQPSSSVGRRGRPDRHQGVFVSQLEVNPVAGEELQKLVAEIYKTPPEIAKQAAQLLAPK